MGTTKSGSSGQLSPFVQTLNLEDIGEKTGNIYESISIISKRSNQLNIQLKEELHAKLAEFASTTDNLEEVFENREQIEISKYYERLPNSVIKALNEFMEDGIYYRSQTEGEDGQEEQENEE